MAGTVNEKGLWRRGPGVTAPATNAWWLALLLLNSPAHAAKPAAKAVAVPATVAPVPPIPSVRNGVELWRAGDWSAAVAMWQPFANAGDADAMFNIGQAYKLGRVFPKDLAAARDWFRRAALKGHLPAQANLGILLYQAGEKPEATRWLKSAADRNEMRAQYVLGVAHWNGDGVPRSLGLAYAYLLRSSAQGLAEATSALGNLGNVISPVERANGSAVAASLSAGLGVPNVFAPAAAKPIPSPAVVLADASARRDQLIKAAPIAAQPVVPEIKAPVPAMTVAPPSSAPVPLAIAQAPAPAQTPAPRPAVNAASVAALAAAFPVAKVPSPQIVPNRPETPLVAPVVQSVAVPASADVKPFEKPKPLEKPVAPPPSRPKPAEPVIAVKPVVRSTGWQVQLGAFAQAAQAKAAWTDFKAKQKQLVGKQAPIYSTDGHVTKLQLGPYKTKAEARDACAKIAFSGRACFVTEG